MTKDKVEQVKATLDLVRKLVTMDIYYSIYDEKCVVQYIYPEDGHKDGIFVGSVFQDPTGRLNEALETGKCIHNFLPMEKLGFTMEGNIVPIYEDGKVCGAVSSAYVPINQQQLAARELAIQSIYHLILAVDARNNHCSKWYFGNKQSRFPMDFRHFDDFCEKISGVVYAEDREEFQQFMELEHVYEQLQKKESIMMECRLESADGEYRWMELVFKRVEEYKSSDVYKNFLFMVRDIHERKAKEVEALRENQELIAQLRVNNQALFEQSMSDELTGLYNRKGLMYFSNTVLQPARKSNLYIYTFVADLNGLKYINDKFGHEQGDRAIRIMAEQLRKAAPSSAMVIRSGGDEFMILAMLEANSPSPKKTEKRFVEKMHEFNSKSTLPYIVEASYGWDFRSAVEVENIDECISYADQKMYEMKAQKKVPGNFTKVAQSEILRRFGSAKQEVLILSMDLDVQKEIASMFGDNYMVSVVESAEGLIKKMR